MDYYLIDLENVGNSGLEGADLLDENSRIVIFYSAAAGVISRFSENLLLNSRADVYYYPVNIRTKNALDFELVFYVGKLASDPEAKRAFIISADNGYQAVLEAESHDKNIEIMQYHSLLEAWYMSLRSDLTEKSRGNIAMKEVRRETEKKRYYHMLGSRLEVDSQILFQTLRDSGDDVSGLYRSLLHAFGREKGLKVYQYLKEKHQGPFAPGSKYSLAHKKPQKEPQKKLDTQETQNSES